MLKTTKPYAAFAIVLFLSACGFQLRGNLELPAGAEPISIRSANSYSPLSIALRNSLSSQQVEVADDAQLASEQVINAETLSDQGRYIAKQEQTQGFQIHILTQQRERRVLSLGAGASVAEYQLIETVIFDLRNPIGQTVMGPITLSEYKALPNDPNKVISSTEETELIQQEMLLALAQKIARQISRFDFARELNKLAKKTTPKPATNSQP
ncbi:LPS assembly lipoprotein LptE [Dasania marina]|uniref:LPS-assembly lipoprotein LptE n=1 Tax=Dasania marina TaxID=471499 RepID=UPI0003670A69|nr:LPS assembly lipoprotein LptE [Dasania marina]